MNQPKIKLRPVVYTTNTFRRGAQNTTQQMMLLKALQVTSDPKKLREMIGVKTVAEVYRTLDKLAMRKEYHEALAREGISFDFIVSGIKNIALTGFKDGDKLKAYQALLKSVGMEKYEAVDGGNSGTWEEILLKKMEDEKSLPYEGTTPSLPKPKYEVSVPKIPKSARIVEEEEEEVTSTIYDEQPGGGNQ